MPFRSSKNTVHTVFFAPTLPDSFGADQSALLAAAHRLYPGSFQAHKKMGAGSNSVLVIWAARRGAGSPTFLPESRFAQRPSARKTATVQQAQGGRFCFNR